MKGCHVTKQELIYFGLIRVKGFLPALTQLREFLSFSVLSESFSSFRQTVLPNFPYKQLNVLILHAVIAL